MFIAASLNPEYFKEKINLFIALAPVGSTEHTSNKYIRLVADHIKLAEYYLVNVRGLYNWWPPQKPEEESETAEAFCMIDDEFCDTTAADFIGPETNRIGDGGYFPSG